MTVSIGTGQVNKIRDILIISVAFILFGAIFLTITITQMNKGADWVPLKAEIVDMVSRYSGGSTTYDVYVSYTYKNVTYPHQLLDTYDISMQLKKIIDIKVNPSDPTKFMYASDGLFNILLAVGGCLIGVGILMPSIWIPIKIHKRKSQNTDSKLPPNSNQ